MLDQEHLLVVQHCQGDTVGGAAELPSLERLRFRFAAHGPLTGLGEIASVRLVLGSYEQLLRTQSRRVASLREFCAKELAALEFERQPEAA